MNYNNQQQFNQPLPFNPQQPQTQPIQYTLDRPPYVPQVQVPQNLSYLLPNVCSMIANEACAQMGKNPGRMFTFNQMANNGFQNAEFATAVATAFDILLLMLAKNIYSVPEAGVNEVVSKTMAILTCRNLAMYSQLAAMSDPRALQEGQNLLNEANMMQQEIVMMKQRYAAPQQQWQNNNQGQYGGGVPSGFAGMPQGNQGHHPGMYPRFGSPVHNNQPQQQWNSSSGPSPFTRGGNPTQTSTPLAENTGRYDYLNKGNNSPAMTQQQIFQQNKPEPMLVQAPAAPVAVPEVKKELVWFSSHHQFHQPAYNTETEKLVLYEIVDGNKTYVLAKVVTIGVNEVDRSKHTLTTPMMAHTSHIPQGSPTRQAAFEKSVEKLTQVESPVLNTKAAISGKALIRNFVEELIFDTKVAQKMVSPENDCGVFQMNCVKGTPFVATKDIQDIASKISDMRNFQEIALTMQSILNSEIDSEVKDFIFELDLMLTKEVNNLLQNKMSIAVTIESFIDDICDISEYLKENKGETFSRAFDAYQEEFINIFLKPIDDPDLVQQMQESLIDPEEGVEVKLSSVFYWHNHTITSIRMHSSELRIGIGEKTSSIITEQSFPVLRSFCKKLFDSVAKEERGYAHHVLVTTDNKKYELHKSLFMPDTYLISNFK